MKRLELHGVTVWLSANPPIHSHLSRYLGRHNGQECGPQEVLDPTGALLNPRWDLRNHSPDGFSWGYGGSGPAQLALAILADAGRRGGNPDGDALAQRFYQDFKWKVVARIPQTTLAWTIALHDVWAWTATQESAHLAGLVDVVIEDFEQLRADLEVKQKLPHAAGDEDVDLRPDE